MVCGDEACNDDFHIRQELVNTRDARLLYIQTHVINAPNAVGDGFTASDVGFKMPLLWTVSFTDGTEQTYLAIVRLKETHVKSIDGYTQEAVLHVSTLMNDRLDGAPSFSFSTSSIFF